MTVQGRVLQQQEGAACLRARHALLALLVWVCLFFFPFGCFSVSGFPVHYVLAMSNTEIQEGMRPKKPLFCASVP